MDEGEYKVGATDPSLFYGVDQIGSVRRVFESAANAPAYDDDPWGVPAQATPMLTDFAFSKMLGKASLGLTWYRGYDPATYLRCK